MNLSYTVITAPCDGYTGRKDIQVGQLIQHGQTLVDIVDAENKWIIANYKETQTANIAVGQAVEIEVDAVPNHIFKGVVRSVSRATGASFSLLPQDNSSGNFVKIEQRIPVRIDFTDNNIGTAIIGRLLKVVMTRKAMLLSQEMDHLSISTSHMQIGKLYGMVQVQALLESMKEIYGWLLFVAILCLIGLMLRYSGIRPVKVIEPTYRFIHNFLRNNTGLLRLRRSKIKEVCEKVRFFCEMCK